MSARAGIGTAEGPIGTAEGPIGTAEGPIGTAEGPMVLSVLSQRPPIEVVGHTKR
jgi:hypothetical protein